MTTFPIAETFHSIQGEGVWTGTPMYFIRLAGCPVGKYAKPGFIYAQCTTVTGTSFLCDTDYHRYKEMTTEELVKGCYNYMHVCLTGGEPLANPHVNGLIAAFQKEYRTVHVETSGTVPIPHHRDSRFWVTCSPKQGFLEENRSWINEWKFLVDTETDVSKIEDFIGDDGRLVFLQPVNGITSINDRTLKHVQEVLADHPNWRLSSQLHKFLGVK